MTSAINPNNIDGAYPVAGQDNNSQGFRDNFTNIKTNFQYASNEITALQNNAILAGNLANNAPVVNNLLGSTLSNGFLQGMYGRQVTIGTTTTAAVNFAAGPFQTVITNGPTTVSFTNFPASGAAATVTLQITVVNVAHTVTLPASVTVNRTGIQGLNPSTNVITFAATGTYEFTFTTIDGGTTVTINEGNKKIQPFNNSSEALVNSGSVGLGVNASYFTTTGPWTNTLTAGVEGQVKVLAMYGDGGDMVVTVINPGWKSSTPGTITFDDIGQTVTLQYINGKWFVIGAGPGGTSNTLAQLA